MIPSEDKSYLGSGSMLIREYGSAAPFVPVGNCTELKLSPQEDVKSLVDQTQPGGNKRNEVRRLTGVDFTYTFTDFSAENFARALRAVISTIAAGSATAEAVVAYAGGYTPLAKIAKTISSVEPVGGGTPYVAGDDYELRDGQLYLPTGTSIPAPVAGAANCEIDYAFDAQKKVAALVNSNKQYSVLFIGLNEAQSGKRTRLQLFKVSGGVLQEMSVLGEDYGTGTVNGSLLSDSTRVGDEMSQYVDIDMED